MESINRLVSSGSNYVGLYLLFMVPTYILPYLGSNSIIMNAAYAASGGGGLILLLLHVACLMALCVLAWARGTLLGKTWIVTFPIVAAVFDIVPILSLIPLVPTVLHICAILFGRTDKDPADPDTFA